MKYFLLSILLVFAVYFAATKISFDKEILSSVIPSSPPPASVEVDKIVKCETDTGKIIYGTPPAGVVCKKKGKVGGNLTITKFESGHSSSQSHQAPNKVIQNMDRCLENDVCREMNYNIETTH